MAGWSDVALVGVVGIMGYVVWTKVLNQADPLNPPDTKPGDTRPVLPGGKPIPSGTKGGFLTIQPDTAYPEHPAHNLWIFDQAYDYGWNFMAHWRQDNFDANGRFIFPWQ